MTCSFNVGKIFHFKYLVFHINITVYMILMHFINKSNFLPSCTTQYRGKNSVVWHISVYNRPVAEDSPVCYQTCTSPLSYMITVKGHSGWVGWREWNVPLWSVMVLIHLDTLVCYILSSVISRNWAYTSREHSPLLLNINL